MSIGGGGGGGSSSQHSTSTSTTPWSGIAGQLAGTLKDNLSKLASGSNLTSWIKSITDSTKQATKEGIGSIKEAFAGSGMAGSTDLMHNLADFQTKQTIGMNEQISQVEQANVGNQLAALSEIISLASGTGSQTGAQWGSNFGWNFASSFGKK